MLIIEAPKAYHSVTELGTTEYT